MEPEEPVKFEFGGIEMMLHREEYGDAWQLSADDFDRQYTTFPAEMSKKEAAAAAGTYLRAYVAGMQDGNRGGRAKLQFEISQLLGLNG